eukprot:15433292-Heterocapsa_arctica.AAC.1
MRRRIHAPHHPLAVVVRLPLLVLVRGDVARVRGVVAAPSAARDAVHLHVAVRILARREDD